MIRRVLFFLGVTLSFCLFGAMDQEDQIHADDHYCRMVKDGHWPDFNDSFNSCIK